MRHRISERARRPQGIVHYLRVQVVCDGVAGYQRVIFPLTAPQCVLCRPHLHPYQRVSRVDLPPRLDTTLS
nr:MAG TPA_asm: transposase-like protein [Caudoviricetes sp.]